MHALVWRIGELGGVEAGWHGVGLKGGALFTNVALLPLFFIYPSNRRIDRTLLASHGEEAEFGWGTDTSSIP